MDTTTARLDEPTVRRAGADPASTHTATIIAVSGELDLAAAPALRLELIDAVEDGHRHLLLDLADVPFMDSTGLGVIVGALNRVRGRGGSLELAALQVPVAKLFRITGLDKVFVIYDTVEHAGQQR